MHVVIYIQSMLNPIPQHLAMLIPLKYPGIRSAADFLILCLSWHQLRRHRSLCKRASLQLLPLQFLFNFLYSTYGLEMNGMNCSLQYQPASLRSGHRHPDSFKGVPRRQLRALCQSWCNKVAGKEMSQSGCL